MAARIIIVICLVLVIKENNSQPSPAGNVSNENPVLAAVNSLSERLGSSCDSLNLVTNILIEEVKQRVLQQKAAEDRISKLENQLANVQSDPVIAFSAQVRLHQRGLTTQQKIPFEDVVTNIGSGYNSADSVFRCPVRGVYQFVVTILSEPNERIETELMAAGVSKMKTYAGGITYFGSGTNSVMLLLEQGDNVFVRLHLSTGSNLHRLWSTFNGHLVRQM